MSPKSGGNSLKIFSPRINTGQNCSLPSYNTGVILLRTPPHLISSEEIFRVSHERVKSSGEKIENLVKGLRARRKNTISEEKVKSPSQAEKNEFFSEN